MDPKCCFYHPLWCNDHMWCHVSAQLVSQSSWLPCLSSVSHSQPLDYVSSCSETRRIWVGKYSHMWWLDFSLLLRSLPCCLHTPSCSLLSLLLQPSSLHTSLLSCMSFRSMPSFCPLRSLTIFPRRKSCSEPHLAKMMLLFQSPLGVENTCSSSLQQSEGNWSNRSFFPMLEMKSIHIQYIPTFCTNTQKH